MTALPLADAPSLWRWSRRTTVRRIVLAVVIAAVFGLALASAFALKTRPTTYFGSGAGIVVADASKSIDPRANQRKGRLLSSIANSGQRLGLVFFSDVAYTLLPPGTNGDEVRGFLRYFVTPNGQAAPFLAPNPWSDTFQRGTNVGRGLALARELIEQDKFRSRSVLLISDLQDSSADRPALVGELDRYKAEHIELRIVPLFPPTDALAYFRSLVGARAIVSGGELLHNSHVSEHRAVVGSFPSALFVLGFLLLLLVALNERACRRFHWGAA